MGILDIHGHFNFFWCFDHVNPRKKTRLCSFEVFWTRKKCFQTFRVEDLEVRLPWTWRNGIYPRLHFLMFVSKWFSASYANGRRFSKWYNFNDIKSLSKMGRFFRNRPDHVWVLSFESQLWPARVPINIYRYPINIYKLGSGAQSLPSWFPFGKTTQEHKKKQKKRAKPVLIRSASKTRHMLKNLHGKPLPHGNSAIRFRCSARWSSVAWIVDFLWIFWWPVLMVSHQTGASRLDKSTRSEAARDQ